MAEAYYSHAPQQRPQPHDNGELILQFVGLPTLLDQRRGEWQRLGDLNDICVIKILVPPKILIYYRDGRFLRDIDLAPPITFHQPQPSNFIIVTARQHYYGIQVAETKDSPKLLNALQFLIAAQKVPASPQQNYGQANYSPPSQQPQIHYGIPSDPSPPPFQMNEQIPLPGQSVHPVNLHMTPQQRQFPPTASSHPLNLRQMSPEQPYGGPSFPHKKPVPLTQNLFQDRPAPLQKDSAQQLSNEFKKLEIKPPTEDEVSCDVLSEAIESGNIRKAQEVATQLASKQSRLTVQLLDDCWAEKKQNFSIVINVEDKFDNVAEAPAAPLILNVDPYKTTIQMLKYQIKEKYQFPPSVQRIIINKRLAQDTDLLSNCGVKTTLTEVCLYLVSYQDAKVKNIETQTSQEYYYYTQGREGGASNLMNSMPNYPMDPRMIINQPYPNRFPAYNVQQELHLPPQMGFMNGYPAMMKPIPDMPGQQHGGTKSKVIDKPGWICLKCTYKNPPTFPGCKMCSDDRPEDYNMPVNYKLTLEEEERMTKEQFLDQLAYQHELNRKKEDAEKATLNYQKTMEHLQQSLLPNQRDFDCPICFTNYAKGEAVMLRECQHCFCRDCLAECIKASADPDVRCPFNDEFPCEAVITGQEIKELLAQEDFTKFLDRSLATAEGRVENSFHCRSPNCKGWCEYEDDVNTFDCPACTHRNCLTCKAIHKDMTCKEYQDELKIKAENDDAAKKTQEMLNKLLANGEAMNCPKCKIILQKKSGCDWMRCTMCLTEICWATKGPRWGPKGQGDNTGGCKCKVNGQRCTPTCGNCH